MQCGSENAMVVISGDLIYEPRNFDFLKKCLCIIQKNNLSAALTTKELNFDDIRNSEGLHEMHGVAA
jgi:hypothetical protein